MENTQDNSQNGGNEKKVTPSNVSPSGNAMRDPDEWITGEEPLTAAQQSYLNTLATEAGEEVPMGLTKAEASKKIEELQEKTGRGK